ncbi:MAG TPA: metallophosphoesterase family protein [Candidatus Limnocylindria bacterium]|jgi:putative phosphoesterase|nr:metallophosphoesterase family protein [Candidatus Limnocylindria bacterium]
MRIGLISDTHGHLDPRIPGLFEGVDHILHAGDIGYTSIIRQLEAIAPTVAVLGNNDSMPDFRESERIVLGRWKFLVHHIVTPDHPSEAVQRLLKHERPDYVIFGHSHRIYDRMVDGIRYLNPGYSGKPKLGLDRTVAVLEFPGTNPVAVFKVFGL